MNRKGLLVTAVLVFAVASMAFAESNIGFKGVGGLFGFIDPDIDETTFAFGPRVDLGTIFSPQVGFMAEFLYWGKSYEAVGATSKWSSMYITALGKYLFGDADSQFKPYAAAGLGLVIGKASVDIPGFTKTSSSDSELAIHLIAGAGYDVSDQIMGFAEFRYVLGGWDFWGVFAGLIYYLGE